MLIGWLLLGACWDALLAVRLALVVQDDLLGCFAETLCGQHANLTLDLNLNSNMNWIWI
jgi:hypothetical protein